MTRLSGAASFAIPHWCERITLCCVRTNRHAWVAARVMVASQTAVQERAMLHGSDRGARFTLVGRTERLVMSVRERARRREVISMISMNDISTAVGLNLNTRYFKRCACLRVRMRVGGVLRRARTIGAHRPLVSKRLLRCLRYRIHAGPRSKVVSLVVAGTQDRAPSCSNRTGRKYQAEAAATADMKKNMVLLVAAI